MTISERREKTFMDWLAENGAKEKFLNNVKQDWREKYLNNEQYPMNALIRCGFSWAGSPEGYKYWYGLYYKWCNFIGNRYF
jgi:hypothetical protein